MKAATDLEEWIESEPVSRRTAKGEKFLHMMLDQLDKKDEERRVRIEKNVAQARRVMGVGKEQPGIMSKLRKGPTKVANTEGCVSWSGVQRQEGCQEGGNSQVGICQEGGNSQASRYLTQGEAQEQRGTECTEEAEPVHAGPARPGWKSSQANSPGMESADLGTTKNIVSEGGLGEKC